MGQFVDLHVNLMALLADIKTAVTANGDQLRIYTDPPVQLPELPCVYLLTPDEAFNLIDYATGESTIIVMLRLCVDQRAPQTTLLALADTITETTDPWLCETPVADPVAYGRRTGMRGVTPLFNDIPVRGADFPIEVHLVGRPVNPAP